MGLASNDDGDAGSGSSMAPPPPPPPLHTEVAIVPVDDTVVEELEKAQSERLEALRAEKESAKGKLAALEAEKRALREKLTSGRNQHTRTPLGGHNLRIT
jgi:type IV secretory pathway VirB10-like protein